MAAGFAFQTGVQANEEGRLVLTFDVLVTGSDVPEGFTYYPSAATVNATDTSLSLRQKVSAAVISDAAAMGISLTAANLTLPTWQKG